MNRPSFLEGAGIALLVSILGGGTLLLLMPLFAASLLLHGIVAATGLGYLIYLLRRGRARTGRVSLLLLWALATAAVALFDGSLVAAAVVQLALAWLTRSLYFHDGVLASLMDLGLCTASLAAAAWAVHQSNSLALTLWCLMLVQAAFVFIPDPQRRAHRTATPAPGPDDPFQRAHRAAEAAVRRFYTVR